MKALDRMLRELEEMSELNNIRLVSGERREDPGVTYFFYMDMSAGRPVSPYFHNKENAEAWLHLNMD
jgi:hypothetical protein